MKILAVDYGDARTGIAISDLLCSIVGSTTVIHSRNDEKTINAISELIRQNNVGELVVGLPRKMDGSEGPGRSFADPLRQNWKKPPDCR